ncbi:MAG: YflJ family protein [Bacillaceae bacterium]|nr:YflJ family protein [Bacillaceae bacterium]
MHIGSKGWYVAELKKRGIRYIDQKKLETFKTYVLANLYAEKKESSIGKKSR